MDTPDTRSRWWRRRGWRLAILVWLALPVAYVAVHGPVAYCAGREWLPPGLYLALYPPFFAFYERYPMPPEPMKSYRRWIEDNWFVPAIDAHAAETDREARAAWEARKGAKSD